MNKKRILFVDDEPNILEGLSRMLRSMSEDWEMEFLSEAAMALELMKKTAPFDVVVSDMRMPGMDGVQFLREVMEKHPEAIRISLSGHMDRDSGQKVAGVANQCLWKPCDAEDLKIAITRAYTLKNRLEDPGLKRLISQYAHIPSLPPLYIQLQKELQSEEVSIKKVGEIISRDLGMSAKILQLVNSAFFGISRTVSNPADAVMILGLDLLSSLVLNLHIFDRLPKSVWKRFPMTELWNHSFITATYAKEIASMQRQSSDIVEGCFIAGLLHDVGKLIFILNMPNEYARLLEEFKDCPFIPHDIETQIMGATHSVVGASLLGTWGLPDPVVEAISFHHNPDQFPVSEFRPLTAVHIANNFDYAIRQNQEGRIFEYLNAAHLEKVQVSNKVESWLAKCISMNLKGVNDEPA